MKCIVKQPNSVLKELDFISYYDIENFLKKENGASNIEYFFTDETTAVLCANPKVCSNLLPNCFVKSVDILYKSDNYQVVELSGTVCFVSVKKGLDNPLSSIISLSDNSRALITNTLSKESQERLMEEWWK